MLLPSQIPQDTVLRQLPEITSASVMHGLFAVYLESGWKLRRLRVRDVRYRPGESCLLTYRLQCKGQNKLAVDLVLHARAFPQGEVPDVFRTRPPLATPVGRLPSYLPQASLALWRFPEDPGLLGASTLWNRGASLFDEEQRLDARPWTRRRPRIDTSVERYVPSERCVLRYDVGSDPSRSFRGKVYDQRTDASSTYRNACHLWDWARVHALELHMPRPLGCNRRLNAIWFQPEDGVPLLREIGNIDLPRTMRQVAAALASLHRSALRPARRLRVRDEAARVMRARETLLRFYPKLEREINRLLQPLIASQPEETGDTRPLHGDFHCNQVQLVGDRVSFRDIDPFALGDPLQDVARFLARFRTYAREEIDEETTIQAQNAFVSTYEILVPWRLERKRLAWWLAAALVNHQLFKGVRRLATLEMGVADLLDFAQCIVQQTDGT